MKLYAEKVIVVVVYATIVCGLMAAICAAGYEVGEQQANDAHIKSKEFEERIVCGCRDELNQVVLDILPKSDRGIWNICNGRAIRVSCMKEE